MRIIGIVFVAIVLSVKVSSGQDSSVKVLTFKDAVKIGLENNVTLAQQENLLVASKTDKTAGLLGLGPTVSINGNAGRNDGNSFIQQEGRVVNGVTDFASATLNARLPLFQGLNNFNTYKQFSSLYEAQLHFTQRTQQEVIRDISRQYLTCLLDQQLVKINEKNLESQEQQYNQIKEQVAAGSRAEVDLLNQEYQVKNANLLLVRARNTLRNDKAILALTLQLNPAEPFDLEEPGWKLSDLSILTVEELYQIAGERRSDLARARHQENAAKFSYRAMKGNYFPSLTAFANYGSAYNYIYPNEVIADPDNRTFDQQFFTDNTQLTYGVSFTIPIYNAFATRTVVVRNKMLYENAKLATKNTEIQVNGEVLLAYQNLRDAQTSFEAADAQLSAAKTSNELERERYRLGISDIVALTQSNQALTRAESDYESARYTLMFQQLLINFATGTLKPEDVSGE